MQKAMQMTFHDMDASPQSGNPKAAPFQKTKEANYRSGDNFAGMAGTNKSKGGLLQFAGTKSTPQ